MSLFLCIGQKCQRYEDNQFESVLRYAREFSSRGGTIEVWRGHGNLKQHLVASLGPESKFGSLSYMPSAHTKIALGQIRQAEALVQRIEFELAHDRCPHEMLDKAIEQLNFALAHYEAGEASREMVSRYNAVRGRVGRLHDHFDKMCVAHR